MFSTNLASSETQNGRSSQALEAFLPTVLLFLVAHAECRVSRTQNHAPVTAACLPMQVLLPCITSLTRWIRLCEFEHLARCICVRCHQSDRPALTIITEQRRTYLPSLFGLVRYVKVEIIGERVRANLRVYVKEKKGCGSCVRCAFMSLAKHSATF